MVWIFQTWYFKCWTVSQTFLLHSALSWSQAGKLFCHAVSCHNLLSECRKLCFAILVWLKMSDHSTRVLISMFIKCCYCAQMTDWYNDWCGSRRGFGIQLRWSSLIIFSEIEKARFPEVWNKDQIVVVPSMLLREWKCWLQFWLEFQSGEQHF